jgi:glucose/arabinose dehydrogenase
MELLEDRVTPAGLVAAYSFNEGAGGTVGDASGNLNLGTIGNATWTASGKFGGALSFNGTNARVTVNDSAALELTSGMTLEAWVNPSTVNIAWRDVIYKGPNDIYYLMAASDQGPPATGGTFSASPLYGTTMLAANNWSHLAATYDQAMLRLYVNGVQVASRAQTGSIATSTGALYFGGDPLYGQYFAGRIDEVRIYNRALTATEIQTDMNTPVGNPPVDTQPPMVSLLAPTSGTTISHVAIISATATDNLGVAGVEFYVDGASVGVDSIAPYSVNWNSTLFANGPHVITAVARDGSANQTTSAPANVTTLNPAFVNEIVVPGIFDATTIAFLPDGRMLVGELTNKILVVQPGASQPDPQPFLDLGYTYQFDEQGLMDIALDPGFAQNGYFYVFYTKGFPGQQNYDRFSRFTASGNGVLPGSELVLWQDDLIADGEHHGGAIAFGTDGKLYFTTGEHFSPSYSQLLDNYRGKVLRINPDGSIPLDNPFYDGAGPNKDAIWAYGLRNPFRMSIDPVTGKMYIGDVGGNDNSTAMEEINLGVRGANYGWPLGEGDSGVPGTTAPIFSYPHSGRDASITGGFVYRGSQFPSEYYGSYFFADYVQNTIGRLTFDAQGNVADVVNFWPADGGLDQLLPGDPVKLVQGPDGSLYYVDLGFNDQHVPNDAAIRRIRYVVNNLPPVVAASANPASGLSPLTVNFSSVGSFDPEGFGLTYAWNFGDGSTSTAANPTHTYTASGAYTATLTVSDAVSSTLSSNLAISVGTRPIPTILGPADGSFFRAGDVIAFSGSATDAEDGVLPPSAFLWEIRFHHEGHIHPGGLFTNTTTGALNIPTSGHDFQGETSYEIVLTVTDSSGLTATSSVTVFPEKVNLSFNSLPGGLTVSIDGINKQTPFVLDDLVGFQHVVAAPNQASGGSSYTFLGWSDGGTQSHGIVVPSTNKSYLATFADPLNLVPGDYNSDKIVDAADYSVWRDQLGASIVLPNDVTPGTVTAADYDVWKAHFGATPPSPGQGAATGASAGNLAPTSAAAMDAENTPRPIQYPWQGDSIAISALDAASSTKRAASQLADFVTLNRIPQRQFGLPGSRPVQLTRATWDSLLLTCVRQPIASANRAAQASAAALAPGPFSRVDRRFIDALDVVFTEIDRNGNSGWLRYRSAV